MGVTTVRRRGLWFALAVALQLMVLVGLVGRHSYTLATGQEVVLKSEPFDPWNPLKGEYVRLRYNISAVTVSGEAGQEPPYQRGDVVWVTLQRGAPFWTAVAIGRERPAVGADQVAVKARVDWVQWWGDSKESPPPGFEHGQVNLIYGMEEFYVPEGEGPGLEQQRDGITVKAKVDRFGRMALSQVLVNGEPVKCQ
jgi:uncharacterized membrane-anchored protein